MDWVSELYDLYNKNESHVGKIENLTRKVKNGVEEYPIVLLPIFHTTAAAQITIDINAEGEFLGAERVSNKNKLTIIPISEASASRTSGLEAHPLCDNLKYLAGDYALFVDGNSKKNISKPYMIYMEQLERWHMSEYSHKKVDAIYNYLKKSNLISDLVKVGVLTLDDNGKISGTDKIQNIAQADSFIRFRVRDKINISEMCIEDNNGETISECWLDISLHEKYIQYYRTILDKVDICYMTGKQTAITYLHSKKIRNEGDGAKLISANDENNFTYRGRFSDKEEAFSIGFETSQKIHNALKWIIRKQGYSCDGFTIAVWESNLQPVPKWNSDTDDICCDYESWECEDEETTCNFGTGEAFASRFKRAIRGYEKICESNSSIVMMSFDAATPGRLALIDSKVMETSKYIINIQYWHDSCRWLQTKYKDGQSYQYMGMHGVKDIADALYGVEQNGIISIVGKTKMYSEICKRLLPCISDKKKVPVDIVNRAVEKASSPILYEKRYNWEKVLGIACALVKKQRLETKKEDCWNMEINKYSHDRSYLYGRLLAVVDRAEYRTYDKETDGKRVTNAKRYMSVFSKQPYRTWKILEEKIQPYMQKLDAPERNTYSKILDEIFNMFEAGV